MEGPARESVAAYVSQMAATLAELALGAGLAELAYILKMAGLEGSKLAGPGPHTREDSLVQLKRKRKA
jgi:hypothetical protein